MEALLTVLESIINLPNTIGFGVIITVVTAVVSRNTKIINSLTQRVETLEKNVGQLDKLDSELNILVHLFSPDQSGMEYIQKLYDEYKKEYGTNSYIEKLILEKHTGK